MGASKTAPATESANSKARSKADPRFATLAPHVKNISQATIRKKWKPLPASSQDKVRQILFDIKTKRCGAATAARIPAVVGKTRGGGGNRRPASRAQVKEDEYEKAVEEVADKLLSRLPRMPFPPVAGGRSSKSSNTASSAADDSAFDLSATLHRIAALQTQLSMNTQSANLLRMQIKREQRALRRDRAELAGLETALKSSQALRRKKELGLHPLARTLGHNNKNDDDDETEIPAEQIERVNRVAGISASRHPVPTMASTATMTTTAAAATSRRGGLSTSLSSSSTIEPTRDSAHAESDVQAEADAQLDPLLNQLRSHLISMQNNTASLLPVLAAMEKAKTTLDRFAVSRFDDNALRQLSGL